MDNKDDQLKVSILSSGSTGNVTYIETPQCKILVDAGLSGKKIENLMKNIGRDLTAVDDLLVTHEHTDHIKSVGVLARRYPNLNIYANKLTWQAMLPKIGKVPENQQQIFDTGSFKALGDLDVQSFGVSHDAIDPQFYEFQHAGKTFVILTDTGYVSERLSAEINDADAYLFECNHDVEMLRMGLYPWPLKQRILGDKGHLSNEAGADGLMSVIGNRTKKVFLGHRSLHNNMKELCHLTVSSMLKEHDYGVDHDFKLYDTEPDDASPLMII
ncbi:MBL fold metallo-hydrolase [Loigolactobacillus iwatensis]|uniref:MBL fold metallo-hydrolase n=1 Tax=Loigolactobacillus iwatensis TaxID=1267156 RepID=UPI000F7EE33D|nr:MBL fold metallo-hydrolase [Loigolactobacillus iwatensis]